MRLSHLARHEQPLKRVAFGLGICSTISIVQGWHLMAMLFSLPFCLIWIYCGWLHTEPQLKNINIVFALFYIYGIARYVLLGA